MYGDKKQIVAAIYFSLMKMIAFNRFRDFDGDIAKIYGEDEELYGSEALILYNQCKSIEIENYLYPELTKLNRTKSKITEIYIEDANSFEYSSDYNTPLDLLVYRKKLPPTEELFYQPLTDCPQI